MSSHHTSNVSENADINVSQGSVETRSRCGGIFNDNPTAKVLFSAPVK